MIMFSNHWFLELVAMTASENHRGLQAITDYYGITNPRGFNADHSLDTCCYCYGGGLKTFNIKFKVLHLWRSPFLATDHTYHLQKNTRNSDFEDFPEVFTLNLSSKN